MTHNITAWNNIHTDHGQIPGLDQRSQKYAHARDQPTAIYKEVVGVSRMRARRWDDLGYVVRTIQIRFLNPFCDELQRLVISFFFL